MVAELFPFQKKAADALLGGANIIIAEVGAGKTATMFNWLKRTNARKVLVVSSPAKIKSCFVAGTKVVTADGEKNIEDIIVGEKVLSYNYRTKKIVLEKVTDTVTMSTTKAIYCVDFSDGSNIIGTEDHPIYVGDGKYKYLARLSEGEYVYGNRNRRSSAQTDEANGSRFQEGRSIARVRVERIQILRQRGDRKTTVHCITVGRTHNFFANNILVHNCDMITEADKFNGPEWRQGLEEYHTVSWYMLNKWLNNCTNESLRDMAVAFDELAHAKSGVSSLQGRAFLHIAKYCKTWAGFTATPGDAWLSFYPYFQAAGKIKNKTAFIRTFCEMNPYTPFPKIDKYKHEDVLKKWWRELSYSPDTKDVLAQLPAETHQVVHFKAPQGYKKVKKTCHTLGGELIESTIALYHELRQMCATKDKLAYLEDILSSLSSPIVIFYNYTCERTQIIELANKMGRKVWRIDGERHEIPTAETTGPDDIVLCHYLSGSEALNLQHIYKWLSYSYNWSYSTSKQARGRIKRIGQAHNMQYWYFVCDGTVEEEVAKALKAKSDFAIENWKPIDKPKTT